MAATERRPEGTVCHSMQFLFPRQPEESPEELILGSGLQVPGEQWDRGNEHTSSQIKIPRRPLAQLDSKGEQTSCISQRLSQPPGLQVHSQPLKQAEPTECAQAHESGCTFLGARQKAPRLKEQAALPEHPGSIPSTPIESHNCLYF